MRTQERERACVDAYHVFSAGLSCLSGRQRCHPHRRERISERVKKGPNLILHSRFSFYSLHFTHPRKQDGRFRGDHADVLIRLHDLCVCVCVWWVGQRERVKAARVVKRSALVPPFLRPFFFTFLMRASGSWWFLNSTGSVPTACTSRICWDQKVRSESDWAWAWAAVCWE